MENNLEWVERLAQTMVENQLYKLEFETEDVSLTLRASQRVVAAPAEDSETDEEDVEEADVILILSKDVGLISMVEELEPGVEIQKGQKLGSVEAVSVEHDLVADFGGTLVEVLVQDGDPVEYGQPLLVLSESEG
jgi:acetyl-CoA carboxylase biotin carboxyl carrier protein